MADLAKTQTKLGWSDFTQNTSFHGIKYIFDPAPSKIRRILWVVCVLLSIGLFLVQVFSRTKDFLNYESNINVKVIYTEEKIPFPAVTICNQNHYRLTSTIEQDLYHFIDRVYSVQEINDVNFTKYPIDGIDVKEFVISSAHQKEDLIDSCLWQGHPCNMADFKVMLTDLGVCYSFNANSDKLHMVSESGSSHGLSLVMNVEQYEYMKGPQSDAGISILLHNQSEVPQMKDLGFSVAPGMHTTIGIERVEVQSLPHPHGSCQPDSAPMSVCLSECKMKRVSESCHCQIINVRNVTSEKFNDTGKFKLCSMEEHFECVKTETDKMASLGHLCNCSIPCNKVRYKPSLSYAQLSKFNIDRMVLKDKIKQTKLLKKFLYARELSQAFVQDYVKQDQQQTSALLSALERVVMTLEKYEEELIPRQDFASKHKIIDIVGNGAIIMKEDLHYQTKFHERIQNLNFVSLSFDSSVLSKDYAVKNASHNLKILKHFYLNSFLGMGYNNSSKLYSKLVNCLKEMPNETLDILALTKSEDNRDLTNDKCFKIVSNDDKIKLLYYTNTNFKTLPQRIKMTYENAIEYVFQDTGRNLTLEFPEHNICLDFLEEFQKETYKAQLLDIQMLLKQWKTNAKRLSGFDILNLTATMIEDVVSGKYNKTFRLISGIYLRCQWMRRYSIQKELKYASPIEQFNEFMKKVKLDERRDMQDAFYHLRTSFHDMLKLREKMSYHRKNGLDFLIKQLKAFRSGNITKALMAGDLDSYMVEKTLNDMFDLSADFNNVASDFFEWVKKCMFNMQKNYNYYFTFALPWINFAEIEKLQLMKDLRNTLNTTGLNRNITQSLSGLHQDMEGTLMQVISYVFEPWRHLAENSRTELNLAINSNLTKAFTTLKSNMVKYLTGNEMDDTFFLDNFMIVDIFYRELSYEKIEQQISFKLLSLFSEIGGFLGLLLGASVLTVCELLDYLVLKIATRVRHTKEDKKEQA